MGGYGSGRRPDYNGNNTIENELAFDIRYVARRGYLANGKCSTWTWRWGDRFAFSLGCWCWGGGVTLVYRHGQGEEAGIIQQNVRILRTPCHYGGERLWWQCPECERRVAIIYGTGKYFACRRCCGLSYASQKEKPADRALRRAKKIRARLGQENGAPASPFPKKPRGMHLMTYYYLHQSCRADEAAWMKSLSAWLDAARTHGLKQLEAHQKQFAEFSKSD